MNPPLLAIWTPIFEAQIVATAATPLHDFGKNLT